MYFPLCFSVKLNFFKSLTIFTCPQIWANSCPGFYGVETSKTLILLEHSWRSFPVNKIDGPTLNLLKFRPAPYFYQRDSEEAAKQGVKPLIVGGRNATQDIQNAATFTGVSFEVLTTRALPNESKYEGQWGKSDNDQQLFEGLSHIGNRRSGDGQIDKNQSLKNVLIHDNQLVVDTYGLSHQIVADPLLKMMSLVQNELKKTQSSRIVFNNDRSAQINFLYKGKEYLVKFKSMGSLFSLFQGANLESGWIGRQTQGSIFNDHIFADWYFELTDLSNGNTLKGDALTSHLIYRYGFYQSGPYRMDPAKIVNFFGL